MPQQDRRTYPVVTATIVFIASISIGIRYARPLLPLDPPNDLISESADFLQQGARQQVDWQTIDSDATTKAKRERKLILLLIGASWSELGRLADREVFSDPDVEALIAKHFRPIRIDVQDQPQWTSLILPLNGVSGIRDPGFQVFVLDPDGRVLSDLGSIGYTVPLNAIEFGDALQGIINSYERFRNNDPKAQVPGQLQLEQEQILLDPPQSAPGFDFSMQLERSLQMISKRPGLGFAQAGTGQMKPHALRFLLRSGQFDAFRMAAAPYVTGGLADWLDGGFFEQIQYVGRRETSFDKRTRSNAAMMEVFAEAACILKDPIFRLIAERTFRWLVDDMTENGLFFAARIGDELPNGRSARSSVSVAQLRESVAKVDLEFARQEMGLRVETNPMMTIRVADPNRLITNYDQFERVRKSIRDRRPANQRRVGPFSCDVSSYVCARLIRTAALLDDPNLAQDADEAWTAIQGFAAGSDVQRSLSSTRPEQPILADYLAFVDACLQRFVAVADFAALDQGEKVLSRAAFLFQEHPGIWLPGGTSPDKFGLSVRATPDVLDGIRESDAAMAMRLCWSFGQIARSRGRSETARQFNELSAALERQYADDSTILSFFGSAFFVSALQVSEPRIAWAGLAIDRNQVAKLSRKCPQALVFSTDSEAARGFKVEAGSFVGESLSLDDAVQRLSQPIRSN